MKLISELFFILTISSIFFFGPFYLIFTFKKGDKKYFSKQEIHSKILLSWFIVLVLFVSIDPIDMFSRKFKEITREELDHRKDLITIKEVVGTWTGILDVDGYRRSEKIIINEDGSFSESNFAGIQGYNNTEGISNSSGRINFVVESNLKKNDFGETIDTIRVHGINFDFQTPYGPRRSRYVFINGSLIVPVETYFASNINLSR